MWIPKHSKDLLLYHGTQSLQFYSNIKTFDFPYSIEILTSPSHKTRAVSIKMRNLYINSLFWVIIILILWKKKHIDFIGKNTEDDIIKMLEFLIDNLFVELRGLIFQKTEGIPMGFNCTPLLIDLFLYTYEAEFIQNLLTDKKT